MKKESVIVVIVSIFLLQIAFLLPIFIAQEDSIIYTTAIDTPILTCNDSDNGLNYGIQGIMTDVNGDVFTDYCEDNKTLYEYACPKNDCITKNICSPVNLDPNNTDAKVQVFYKIYDVQAIVDDIDMGITQSGFTKIYLQDSLTHNFIFKKDGYKDCIYNTTFVSGNISKISISLVKLDSTIDCNVVLDNLGFISGSKNVCNKQEDCKEIIQTRNYTCTYGCEEGLCLKEKKIAEVIKNLSNENENSNDTLLGNVEETNTCPEITTPDCRYGELKSQGPDSNWCPQGFKCIKKLSDGSEATIKVSSEKAIESARKQYGDVDFRVDLVETNANGKFIAVYKLDGEKVTRFFFFFKKRTPISVNVNAETGDIVI